MMLIWYTSTTIREIGKLHVSHHVETVLNRSQFRSQLVSTSLNISQHLSKIISYKLRILGHMAHSEYDQIDHILPSHYLQIIFCSLFLYHCTTTMLTLVTRTKWVISLIAFKWQICREMISLYSTTCYKCLKLIQKMSNYQQDTGVWEYPPMIGRADNKISV